MFFYANDIRTALVTPNLEPEINRLDNLNLRRNYIALMGYNYLHINKEIVDWTRLQSSNLDVNPNAYIMRQGKAAVAKVVFEELLNHYASTALVSRDVLAIAFIQYDEGNLMMVIKAYMTELERESLL